MSTSPGAGRRGPASGIDTAILHPCCSRWSVLLLAGRTTVGIPQSPQKRQVLGLDIHQDTDTSTRHIHPCGDAFSAPAVKHIGQISLHIKNFLVPVKPGKFYAPFSPNAWSAQNPTEIHFVVALIGAGPGRSREFRALRGRLHTRND